MLSLKASTVYFSAAALGFLTWVFVVTTQVFPSEFFAPVRGKGLVLFSTGEVLTGAQSDRLLLTLFSLMLLLVPLIGAVGVRSRRFVPGFALAAAVGTSLFLWVAAGDAFFLLLPISGVALVAYAIYASELVLGEGRSRALEVVLVPGAAVAAGVSVASAATWFANGLEGTTPLSDSSWGAGLFVLRFSALLYPLLPRLALFFFASWALKIGLAIGWGELGGTKSRVLRSFGTSEEKGFQVGNRTAYVILALAAVLAAFVGAYAYLPAVNPSSTPVGVDVRQFYYGAAQNMSALTPSGAVGYAFSNDRSVYLMLQYLVNELSGSVQVGMSVVPLLLSVLLTLSAFWFTKTATGDNLVASAAALLSPLSFHATAGVEGGLYANLLAVSETFLFFSTLLLAIRGRSRRYLLAAAGSSALLLFTHPWTWSVVMGVAMVYAVSRAVWSRLGTPFENVGVELRYLGFVLLVSFLADAAKRLLPTGSGIEAVYYSTSGALGFSNVLSVVGNLESTFTVYLAGALADPVLLVIAIAGVFSLGSLRDPARGTLLCWAGVASIGAIFSNEGGQFLQSRIVYVIPFEVFGAIGFVSILRFINSAIFGPGRPRKTQIFSALAIVALVSALAGYALQDIGYLYR